MGTAQQTAAQKQQVAINQNAAMRNALLQTAPRMRKLLGTFGPFALGDLMTEKLFNVGVGTSLDIVVSADVDESTALTPSVRAPFNLISNIDFTDYDGTHRVNCSGFQLFLQNTLSQMADQMSGYHNSAAAAATCAFPSVPTSADGKMIFALTVPIAYGKNDLRGAMLMQTATGEAYLNITFNRSGLGSDDDSVYKAGTVGTASPKNIYVTVYQNYLAPLQIGNVTPLPLLDLSTVYELNGSLKTSDSLAAGVEKLLNYPNARTVLGLYLEVMDAGSLHPPTTNVEKLMLRANGNTDMQTWGPYDMAYENRKYLGCDLPPGVTYLSSRERPIETQLYGNMQAVLIPSSGWTGGGNSYVGVMLESFYAKGQTLPGMSQG